MRDAAGEPADRLHLLRLAQRLLEPVDLEQFVVLHRERLRFFAETRDHPEVLRQCERHAREDGNDRGS